MSDTLRIAHLILAYKNPIQLERLIQALRHDAFDLYIHLDEKSDFEQFRHLSAYEHVYFIENRCKVYWAGYGFIQATINSFREILPKNKYDYINLISAQDFPIKPIEDIYQYILSHKGTEFISCEPVIDQWTEAAVRVEKYHFVNWRTPGKYKLEKLVNAILPKRKFPLNYEVVGRSAWFTLTNEACAYALKVIDENPEIPSFFKYSWGADELFFNTILYNSPFRARIVPNLIYVDWAGQTDGHPRILGKDDYHSLINSDKLFARKMDIGLDPEIIDKLENYISSPK